MATSNSQPQRDAATRPRPSLQGLYPLRFEPILKQLIWGGRRLGTILNKPLGEGSNYAESWELADHRDVVSRIAEGPLSGVSLRELIRERGKEVLGWTSGSIRQFPLLVKFLDANEILSVQVHPDDSLGRRLVNDNGKTEAWVVVHAEPGSFLYAGLKTGVDKHTFAGSIQDGSLGDLLHRVEPVAGDCFLIPAGIVHAIGAGIVVAEVQQMSDATFRIHDWGRLGPDGQPRALHLVEAIEATDFRSGPVQPVRPRVEAIQGGSREQLAACPYFALERLRLTAPGRVGSSDGFTIVIGVGGYANVRHAGQDHALSLGQTLLLPAEIGPCELIPRDDVTVLTCVVP